MEKISKPGLLLFAETAERLLGGALSEKFEIIRLWQATDRDAFLAEHGAQVVAVLTWQLEAALLDVLPNLKLIAVPGAGYDQIPVAAAQARGIRVVNAGDTHSGDVADHALALVLASIHRLPALHASVLAGDWRASMGQQPRAAMSAQRFGIVGLGYIGAAIAERLTVFGGEIAWWGRRDKPAPWPRYPSLIELARWSSVLIIAARGDAERLIGAEVINAVGPAGHIVNISRGAVIDEDALIAALKEGRLGGAALDVFTQEPTPAERWRDVPNLVLTPHVAGASQQSITRLRDAAIRNLTSALDGSPAVNEITL